MSLNRNRILENLGLALFLGGLGLFTSLGIYNRFWADDWCVNRFFKDLGFIGTMQGYNYITVYASNRFAMTFFSGLVYNLGMPGLQAMTGLIIAASLSGLYWTLNNIRQIADLPFPRRSLFLISGVVVYFWVYLAPHLYQSFYWQSGALTYTIPIAFGVLAFGLITHQGVREKPSNLVLSLSALTGFIGGGFSESGSVTLVAALVVYIVIALVFRKQSWARRTLPTALVTLIFALAAMALLVFAPTNVEHVNRRYGGAASLQELPGMVLRFSFGFAYLFVKEAFPVHATIFLICAIAAFSTYSPARRLTPKNWLYLLIVLGLLTYLLIAASYTPSAYVEKGIPAPRGRIAAGFVAVLGVAAGSSLTGYFLAPYIRFRAARAFTSLLLLASYAFTAYTIHVTSDRIPIYSQRASLWDERDAFIREAVEQGVSVIHVKGIDGLPVGGIRDFKDQVGRGVWVNVCAQYYYGAEQILADQ